MANRQTRELRIRIDASIFANAQKLAAFEKMPMAKWFNMKLYELIKKEMESLPESQRIPCLFEAGEV